MEISLVFLGAGAMRALNKTWRNKDAETNVLAFPLDASTAEVFIDPHTAAREAAARGISYTKHVVYLFLHGLLHVYGYDHETAKDARNMERREHAILRQIFTQTDIP